jgi:diacylglycerol O-acyltransferase
VQHALMDAFNDNASSTMTNVPGPREQLFFAGEAIRNMVFFGPQSGKMGVGLSVFSYQDTLTMGISADKGMIPHPEVFTACFEQELREWLAHPG